MNGPFKLKNKKDFDFGNNKDKIIGHRVDPDAPGVPGAPGWEPPTQNENLINQSFNIEKGKINEPIVASGVDENFMTNKVKRAQGKEITVK